MTNIQKNKISILDGAMGSELILRGEVLPPHIWSAKVNLSKPNLILDIHKEHIKAGSNFITANTFRTTPRAYRKTGLSNIKAYKMAKKSLTSAVNIAKVAANHSVKILGSIAPLEDCYSPEIYPGAEIAKEEFTLFTNWLNDAGIDGFILETMNNIQETTICLEVIKKFKLPVWVSFNLLNSSHIKSGEKLKEAIKITSKFDVECILLNCNPIERTRESMKIISKNFSKWGIYPNLGIGEPSPDGVISDYYTDEDFINICKDAINLGASIIGGCCGSSPRHIKLLLDRL